MPRTPKRAGRTAAAGSMFLSEIVARNVRNYRALRGLHQAELARVLARLGHGWVAGTVSEVERNGRSVTVDELAGLAVALRTSVAALLDPVGPQRSEGPAIDVGGDLPIPTGPISQQFITDPKPDDQRARIVAALAGLTTEGART
jgi:transcriptional regulator with XRE-family HTH domain